MLTKHEALFEKAIFIKNDVTSRILPNVINHIVLVSASLMVLLVTLSDPGIHSIYLYRALLCTLLSTTLLGVLGTSTIAFDFYRLGIKVSEEALKSSLEDREPKPYIRSGKLFYFLIVFFFVGTLVSFLTSLILLLLYAWNG